MPAPATSTALRQREGGLVLDVLDANLFGPAEEDRVRVRRVDDVVDLHAELLRLDDVLVRGLHEHREVVQQRALGIARLTGVELDPRTADLDARGARRGRLGGLEPERLVLGGGRLRIRGEEGDVVEVVVDVGRRRDEADPDALA